ncbi:hypothetical protein TNCV_421281 [Trichonephila clavipes]|nr:hypothetical protein TNCV_421281 [Trichonephila clavipes]
MRSSIILLKCSPVCDAASRLAVVLVSELRVNAASIVELFVQIFDVLQATPIPDSVLVACLHDPLRSCGFSLPVFSVPSDQGAVEIQHGAPYYCPETINPIFC